MSLSLARMTAPQPAQSTPAGPASPAVPRAGAAGFAAVLTGALGAETSGQPAETLPAESVPGAGAVLAEPGIGGAAPLDDPAWNAVPAAIRATAQPALPATSPASTLAGSGQAGPPDASAGPEAPALESQEACAPVLPGPVFPAPVMPAPGTAEPAAGSSVVPAVYPAVPPEARTATPLTGHAPPRTEPATGSTTSIPASGAPVAPPVSTPPVSTSPARPDVVTSASIAPGAVSSGAGAARAVAGVVPSQPGHGAVPDAATVVPDPQPVAAAPFATAVPGLPTTSAAPLAAQAPGAPPAAPAAPLASQLAGPLFTLAGARPGEHVLTINVAPDNLGPVTVRAHITGDAIRVELFAPTEAGRDALRAMLPDLRRDLSGSGMNAQLNLSSGSRPDDQPGGPGADRGAFGRDRGEPDARPDAGRRRAAVASELTAPSAIAATASTIDVMA